MATGGRRFDVAIVGCGPAGLQAAIHAARRRAGVLVLGRASGSAAAGARVANLAGFREVAGEEILATAASQARSFGAELVEEDAVRVAGEGGGFAVEAESRATYSCAALVLAMGVTWEKLDVPGEKALLGRGVSHCVDCDAAFFRGAKVAVVGGGSAAVEGALRLLEFASEVHLVARSLEVSPGLAAELDGSPVARHVPAWPAAVEGQAKVEGLVLEGGARLDVAGVFVELGAKGALSLTAGLEIDLDPETMRHVVTDRRQRTSLAGVFAAGDVTGPPYQIAKALGEGCVAGLSAAEHAAQPFEAP